MRTTIFPARDAREGFAFIASRSRRQLGKFKASSELGLDDGFVDEAALLAVLDFDDPDVGIEADLPGEVVGAAGFVGRFAQGPRPDALLAAPRRAQHGEAAIQGIELQ